MDVNLCCLLPSHLLVHPHSSLDSPPGPSPKPQALGWPKVASPPAPSGVCVSAIRTSHLPLVDAVLSYLGTTWRSLEPLGSVLTMLACVYRLPLSGAPPGARARGAARSCCCLSPLSNCYQLLNPGVWAAASPAPNADMAVDLT